MSFDPFLEALGVFGKFFWVYISYSVARNMTVERTGPKWKAYLSALGVCAAISCVVWVSYGTHREDADPLFGGGEVVVDLSSLPRRNEMSMVSTSSR